jgi:inorganic pyrophosphatase
MDQKVNIYIEIEKDSNIKYEFCKKKNTLIIDRLLDKPYVYPYAYGFIPNTLAEDGDELDVLILTDDILNNDTHYIGYIVGCLVMEDEKGMDEKILCVFEKDYEKIKDLNDIDDDTKNKIYYFFENYKKKTIGKWSNVIGFINKELSINLYNKSIIKE